MKSKFLSIVIPAYNSQFTIGRLLGSVGRSNNVDFEEIEVIVADDKSDDGTAKEVKKFVKFIKFLKLVKLKVNSGPARARNTGVKLARGKIILFLDADVVLFKNTLSEVINSFKEDVDMFALTGVWSREQKNHKFFPKFKALRDWSYWINERDPKNYYYLFSTRIAAIDRKLFLRLGGFDTTYKAALIEDIELTYRIARRYAVVFNPKVMVKHEFEDFLPIARKYFWRSYYWSRLYRARKKFDPVATTSKEAATTVSAALATGFLLLSIFLAAVEHHFHLISAALFLFFLIIHLWGVRKFLIFTAREEGVVFTVKSFFTGLVLYLIILSGAVYSYVADRNQGQA